MVRGRVHVAVRQDGRVLEGDGLAAAAPLVRTLLRVVHLKQTEGVSGNDSFGVKQNKTTEIGVSLDRVLC